MNQTAAAALQRGRDAFARHAWPDAYGLLGEADASEQLPAEDLDRLSEASWWTGRLAESIDAEERAYAAYIEAGNRLAAATAAGRLFTYYHQKGDSSMTEGWGRRRDRLLEGEDESPEHGFLILRRALAALDEEELGQALQELDQAERIADLFENRDLQVVGLYVRGLVRIEEGETTEGLALLDEVAAAAVGGELTPYRAGAMLCNVIATCLELADYGRASEAADAAQRWCDRQDITGFPGVCRVDRATIMRLRGTWREAEREALRARQELTSFGTLNSAREAIYELGEIRLCLGDLGGAGDAFREAHELGRQPQPGLSLLQLAEGNSRAAAASITRALADEPSRLARVQLLPTQVEVAIATGDAGTSRQATEELESLADTYGTAALKAAATTARGAYELSQGQSAAAAAALRRAVELWQQVDMPYECAKMRLLLAQAYEADRDTDGAVLELQAAKTAFDRLGATKDSHRASQLLQELGGTVRPASEPGARATNTFLFTDIVGSTRLVEAIGDEAWENLVGWHDQTLRSLFAKHGGLEIDHSGDGFFVVFDGGQAAVECAVMIQRTLAGHRREHGFAPQVRVGLHTCKSSRSGTRYTGKGVHEAARIAALAGGEEILASQKTLDGLTQGLHVSEPRVVKLKGIAQPVPVVTIEWR
ncbi:MAG: adenylate/guanylate cyclase domain-containing protein [Acidimicrobiia bacterium]